MQDPDNTSLPEPVEGSFRKINAFAISLLQQNTLEGLLWSLVDNVGQLLGYEDCVIYLLEGDTLVQSASFATRDPQLRDRHRNFRLPLGRGIVGRVAQTKKAAIVRDTREDPKYVADDFAGLSELSVPIIFEGRVLGVLDTESQQAGAYDEADCALLQFIANIAACRIASALAAEQRYTERARAEEDRTALLDELRTKNAELERFTYTVSHDLKSPLITIRGFLGLLEQDLAADDSERVKDDLKRIGGAVDNMGKLLDDLLALSRVGRVLNTSQAVDLYEVATEAADRVAGRVQERGVKIEIATELPVVFGDRLRLLEVFQNLLDNAVKFMGDQPQPRIEIGQRQEGEQTLCYVRDNGVGIKASQRQKIFGLFQRLDAKIEGTGIGLALVKRIVEIHGGRIWVESGDAGSGSTFCLELPSPRALMGRE